MFLSYKLHSNKKLRELITDCTVAMAKCYAVMIITESTVKIGCVVVCSDSTCKKCRKQLLASLGIFWMHPFNIIVWDKNYTALGQTCTMSLIVEALASYGHLMARCYEGTNKMILIQDSKNGFK